MFSESHAFDMMWKNIANPIAMPNCGGLVAEHCVYLVAQESC